MTNKAFVTTYTLTTKVILNQNRPIILQCSRPLFIGNLRDSSKIIHLPIRARTYSYTNCSLLFFLLGKHYFNYFRH